MINLTRRSFLFDGTGRRGESRFALRHSPRSQELLWAPRRSPQRFFTLAAVRGRSQLPAGSRPFRWLSLLATSDSLNVEVHPFTCGLFSRPQFAYYTPHFNLSTTLAMPAIAQASSLSPPTAPLTPTAPIVSLPTLIGTPPATPAVPSMLGIGDPKVDPQAFAASPDVFHREANVSAV